MRRQISVYLIGSLSCFMLIFSCKKSDGGDTPAVVPAVKIEDASQVRTTSDGVMHFNVTLNKTTTVPVSVSYTVVDGSAVAPKDYTTISGKVTIAANDTRADIAVPIKADPNNTRQNNIDFSVQLSNPSACTLGVTSATGTIITEDGTNFVTDNTGYTTPTSYAGYTLAWSDEFDGTSLNLNYWNQETGNGQNGWGNNELEYYTATTKNCLVSNGNLIIEARKESISGFNYSSARLTTQNKKTFKFGRIDMRAKLPVSKGMWPALWMLGANIPAIGWPACGEIDMMELIGTYPGKVYGTAHWKSLAGQHASKGSEYSLSSGNFSQQFHVFSLVWTTDKMTWLVDDHEYISVTKADAGTADYPFNAPEFIIFNLAVGGDWPGPPDGTTTFPQRMIVDYVRVFQ